MRATGIVGTKTTRIYVNTTNDLTGAVLLGTVVTGVAALFAQMKRDLVIKSSTNTEVIATGATINTDDSNANSFSQLSIDWTTDKYIIFANLRASSSDTLLTSFYTIEKI
jgi:hypothetical protein